MSLEIIMNSNNRAIAGKKRGQLINSKKDIKKLLNEACRWLNEHEHASVVIPLLENAVDMLDKEFWDAVAAIRAFTNKITDRLGTTNQPHEDVMQQEQDITPQSSTSTGASRISH